MSRIFPQHFACFKTLRSEADTRGVLRKKLFLKMDLIESLFNKVYQKETTQVFPVNIVKFLRTPTIKTKYASKLKTLTKFRNENTTLKHFIYLKSTINAPVQRHVT